MGETLRAPKLKFSGIDKLMNVIANYVCDVRIIYVELHDRVLFWPTSIITFVNNYVGKQAITSPSPR